MARLTQPKPTPKAVLANLKIEVRTLRRPHKPSAQRESALPRLAPYRPARCPVYLSRGVWDTANLSRRVKTEAAIC
jgi:hypothetical protein